MLKFYLRKKGLQCDADNNKCILFIRFLQRQTNPVGFFDSSIRVACISFTTQNLRNIWENIIDKIYCHLLLPDKTSKSITEKDWPTFSSVKLFVKLNIHVSAKRRNFFGNANHCQPSPFSN